jgi:transposase-like protein
MRPVSVFAKAPGSEIEQLRGELQGRWRQAVREVMVLLSLHGLPPSQIAELLDCHPATVRRWITRFNAEGLAGLAGPAPARPASAGRTQADEPDRRAARAPGPVDPAADPPLPGLAAGQPADAVPAGPAGGDLAAAQADRPRRPGP